MPSGPWPATSSICRMECPMRSGDILALRTLLSVVALATLLAGCSDIYFDRRETISFHGGDASLSNVVAQTYDPWPQASANREIEGNGDRMQKAVERYRTNKTTPLSTGNTSSVQYAPIQAQPVA